MSSLWFDKYSWIQVAKLQVINRKNKIVVIKITLLIK